VGSGHLYQGRFKSFVIQADDHLLQVCRYVERNPLRSKLVRRAEDWRWGSLWRRTFGSVKTRALISELPVERPANWIDWVNQPEPSEKLKALRISAHRGTPFGNPSWVLRTTDRLQLQSTLASRGRPRKGPTGKGS